MDKLNIDTQNKKYRIVDIKRSSIKNLRKETFQKEIGPTLLPETNNGVVIIRLPV